MAINNIDAKTLKKWLDNNEAMLVDVRECGEYCAEHIAGSVHIPLAQINISALPEASGKKLVMQCKAGKRGGNACEKLFAESPDRPIYNLEGGIDAWKQAGFAVESSGRFFLPLDQQVQLTIGVALLISSLLGYYISSSFFLLTGFFGLGLAFAGLTGWCGLAYLIARMPWNRRIKSMSNKGVCNV